MVGCGGGSADVIMTASCVVQLYSLFLVSASRGLRGTSPGDWLQAAQSGLAAILK